MERDVVTLIRTTLLTHPHIREVQLVGSRAAGTEVPLSDWDFRVESDDFAAVASDLPALASGLEPLAQQWDRLSTHQCYMLLLTGPAKIDLLFLDQPHEPKPPWMASPETLPGIDRHFWDWALWLAAKQQAGRDELVRRELNTMAEHLLVPLGVLDLPESLVAAVASYRAARDLLESRFNVAVTKRLEQEVLPVLPSG
jgi:hypothetical protein